MKHLNLFSMMIAAMLGVAGCCLVEETKAPETKAPAKKTAKKTPSKKSCPEGSCQKSYS